VGYCKAVFVDWMRGVEPWNLFLRAEFLSNQNWDPSFHSNMGQGIRKSGWLPHWSRWNPDSWLRTRSSQAPPRRFRPFVMRTLPSNRSTFVKQIASRRKLPFKQVFNLNMFNGMMQWSNRGLNSV
jgi:hypothetical protein